MGTSKLLLVGIVIVGALLISGTFALPSIIQGVRDGFQDIRDAFFDDWGGIFANQTSADQQVSLNVVVHFKDGTSKDYAGETLSILPLLVRWVEDPSNPMESVTFTLRGLVDYSSEATLDSLSCTGSFVAELSGGSPFASHTLDYTGTPARSTWFDIDSITVSATDIETAIGWGIGTVKATGDVTFHASFTSGDTDTQSGTALATISVSVEYDQLTVWNLQVNPSVQLQP